MSATPTIGSAILTVTGAIGPLSTVINIPSPKPTRAAAQSVLDAPHTSPTVYDPSNPIVVFIIQACIIIIFSRILSYPLQKIRQPRVIADIIAGILLGPSAFGRINVFTRNIFPPASIPNLNLVANLGLVLFLFLVGIETDIGVFKKHFRTAFSISVVGMVIPFGLGAAVSVGVYNNFIDSEATNFGHFLLFIGVAMAITAFPVLARILTELRLLSDHVGVATLAAGVGNDIVGWTLLALAVTLTNAGKGISVLYVILCSIAWILILCFLVRPLFIRFLHRSGGFEKGPSQGVMILILVLVLASAFITQIIGIHAIFGGFLVGVVMPHNNGFATGLVEKIEDLVTVLFLPLYFALSGLRTDLGLLRDGSIWGWTICVIVVAFVSKFSGCFAAAKFCGFTLRESLAVGSLMSCKGLVELIVLNIGLQAGILNSSVFAMFVVMALVTTFATTPLTLAFYPVWYRNQQAALRRQAAEGPTSGKDGFSSGDAQIRSRFAVVLDRLDHLPSTMAFIKLLQPLPDWASRKSISPSTSSLEDEKSDVKADLAEVSQLSRGSSEIETIPISVDAIRLVEITERYASMMRASETEAEARHDPISNILRTFAGLNSITLDTTLSITTQDEFAESVVRHATNHSADMLVVPWAGATASDASTAALASGASTSTPFDALFGRVAPSFEHSPQYAAFVRQIFLDAPCDVALFLDRSAEAGSAAMAAGRQRVFFAFHGGPDDRAALSLVLQLCRHPGVSATIVRIVRSDEVEDMPLTKEVTETTEGGSALGHFTVSGSAAITGTDTVYGAHTTQHQLQSETADNIALGRYFTEDGGISESAALSPSTRSALSRVSYTITRTSQPLKTTLARAQSAATASAPAPLLVVAGRSRRAAASHRDELAAVLRDVVTAGAGNAALGLAASSEVRKTLGDIGSGVVASGGRIAGSLLVVQAGTGAPASAAERVKEV